MISALVGHLVGDYLLQNDWMAKNKKKYNYVCATHAAIWSSCVMLFALWPAWTWLVLFITHFAQDRTNLVRKWMDYIGQTEFATGVLAPWSIIVVDNVWHVFTIWLIWCCI